MLKQSWYLIWSCKYPIGKPNHAILTLMLCYVLLFFSSCSNPLSSFDSATLEHPTPTLSQTTISSSPKGIRTESNVESPLKAQQAKVQQIMAGMTLDQKLGQLLIVEDLGNNYTSTEPQYLISKQ